MKKTATKFLAVVLGVTLVLGLIPAATAARQADLRQVVVNQAKAFAELEWHTVSTRIARNDHSAEKKAAMHEAGVLPTSYFEYNRTHVKQKGAMVENNAASMEKLKTTISADGVQSKLNGKFLGVNVDSFLVDLVSRVSAPRFTTVKEALSSPALKSLLPAANTAAASSAAAIAGVSATELTNAYSSLEEGDLLIAYDDNAVAAEMPKSSVLVVTYLDGQNTGEVTVTYPAFLQPLYIFTCDKCGFVSTEGPTSAVPSKHVKSTSNYAFKSFAKHNGVDTASSCDGTLQANYATTWYTQTLSFDQLKNGFTGGGVGYLPYSLSVYADGNTDDVKVNVYSNATADSLAAGFKATVSSNYRIVQVDAVLSQPGKADRVFSSYPEWNDWTYEFVNEELDKALFESTSGSYSLALNVHSGPVTNPSTMEVPVTKAYTLELSLEAPSFALVSPGETVHQGQEFTVGVRTMVPDVNGASMKLSYDKDYFVFDQSKSEKASPSAKFTHDAKNGTIAIEYSGAALRNGGFVAQPYFKTKRSGALPTAAEKVDPFELSSALVATGGELSPARVGGEQVRPGVGYNIVIHKNYVGNYDMIVLFSEGTPLKAEYAGTRMLDINEAYVRADGILFSHAYAYVTENADPANLKAEAVTSSAGTVMSYLVPTSGDVNRSGLVDINDVQCIQNIIDGTLALDQNRYLRADIDHNGKVDTNDMAALLRQLKK